MRRLGEADRGAIEAFLSARIETSMFPLSNLIRHGMAGGHPLAMRVWGAGEPLQAVVGVTGSGMVLPQLPPSLAPEAAEAIAGERVTGMAGEGGQVAALRAALGLGDGPVRTDKPETLMTLDLAGLRVPEVEGLTLTPLSEAPRDLLVAWGAAYRREVLGRGEGAEDEARADVEREVAGGQHRVLWRGGEPVAATGFNARAGDAVQVGGVWTPPGLWCQGLARAAVALHLAEARDEGARRAILFTSSPFAARAYRALGFLEVGQFTLLILDGPREVRLVQMAAAAGRP